MNYDSERILSTNKPTDKSAEVGMLPNDWEYISLGEITEITSSKRIFMSEYVSSGVPFYRGKEIIEKAHGNKDVSTPLYISEERYQEILKTNPVPKKGDILLSSVGTLGVPFYIAETEKFYFKDGNITWFRNFCENTDSRFIYYWIQSPVGKVALLATSIGSTQSALTIDGLKKILVPLPPKKQQKSIAEFLSVLDAKIDANNRIIHTIESIAQTVYKHWFIDFDFPDENGNPYKSSGGKMTESDLGELPNNWQCTKLRNIAKIVCGKTPSKSEASYFGGDIPFIKIPDMHNKVFVTQTEDSLTQSGAESQINKYVPPYSICVSCIATVGLVSMTSISSQTNQQINTVVPNKPSFTYFLYLYLNNSKVLLENMGSGGSTTLNVNASDFSNLQLLNPGEDLLKKYHTLVSPMYESILNLQKENVSIRGIKNLLLPKLISGKVRLPC